MTFSKKNHSTPLHSTHSTELFKIFFSLLTLSTAFLQKASGPGKKVTEAVTSETAKFINEKEIAVIKISEHILITLCQLRNMCSRES